MQREDFIKRPQLNSVLKNQLIKKDKILVNIDDLLLHEYYKILMMFVDVDYPPPKGFKIVNYNTDGSVIIEEDDSVIIEDIPDEDEDPELIEYLKQMVSEKTCSNCHRNFSIVKSAYSPVFVIHLCEYCNKAFNFSFEPLLD